MANKYKIVVVDATLEYPKVFESNRDMGNEQVDYSDTDGMYKVDIILDDTNKAKAIASGFPEKQGAFAQFKEVERDGVKLWKTTVRRPHLHPRFMELDEDGQPTDKRLVVGEPFVFDLNRALARQAEGGGGKLEDFAVKWTQEDGFLSNGTKGKVKLKIESGVGVNGKAKGKPFTRVQLEGIALTDIKIYEGAANGGWV